MTTAAKLRCPIFLVLAEADDICPPSGVRAVAAKAGAGAAVLTLPVGHFDIHGGAAFEFSAAAQVDFLTRTLAPAPTAA